MKWTDVVLMVLIFGGAVVWLWRSFFKKGQKGISCAGCSSTSCPVSKNRNSS